MQNILIETPRAFKPFLQPSRYKGAYGGRGSGKSHFFAEMAIERCILDKTAICCAREIQKSLKNSVKKLLEIKIEQLGVGHLFDVQDTIIKGLNGSEIIFTGLQSHTSDSIKSLESFDVLWIEEAQNVSQKSLDIVRPTFRKPGSEIWVTWNPGKATDPVDAFLRCENPPPDAIVCQVNYMDNPWFPEVLRDEMEYDRKRDYDKYCHVWLGEYQKNSEARIFKNFVIEDFERPEGTIYRLGADWGYSVDPSTLVRVSTEGNRLYIDYEAYMVGCEIVNLPDLFDRVPESRKWFCRADSARPEVISYMRKNGYPRMQSAMKGKDSIEEGIQFLQSFDMVVHPRCAHLIDELNSYSYKRDKLTDEILPIIEDKNNHLIDALRYACEGIRKASTMKRKETVNNYRMPQGLTGWMGN
ncbi:MAG: PBSX family phage terminase large subunit [Sulfurimonas sp.]|jgi:phage terminase large subunit